MPPAVQQQPELAVHQESIKSGDLPEIDSRIAKPSPGLAKSIANAQSSPKRELPAADTSSVCETRVKSGSSQTQNPWNQSDPKSLCDGTRVELLKIITKQGGTRVELDLPWFRHRVMKVKP